MPKPIKIDQHILETASRLFHENGIRATGVDKIVAEAGIAKSTLYYHFKTKNDLIIAIINQAFDALFELVERSKKESVHPIDKIENFYRAFVEWIHSDKFYFAVVMKAVAEFGNETDTVVALVLGKVKQIQDEFEAMAVELNAHRPDQLARNLSLINAGISFRGMIYKQGVVLEEVLHSVHALLRAHEAEYPEHARK